MASGLFDLDLSGGIFGNIWRRGLRSSFCVGAICQTVKNIIFFTCNSLSGHYWGRSYMPKFILKIRGFMTMV